MSNAKILHIINSTFDYSTINSNSKLLESVDDVLLHNEYHTSVGDLTADQILNIADKFEFVDLVMQGFDTDSDIFKESQILVEYLSGSAEQPEKFVELDKITQRPDTPVVWVFGCSHSAGIGLQPNEKSYGEILANNLQLPLKLVALPGSSLNWSLRQLMNAEIKPKDIVIWQLTSPDRTSINSGLKVNEVMLARTPNRFLLEVFTEEQLYFNQISLLNFGTQYLRSLGNRFVLISLESNLYTYEYRKQYIRYPEYCYVPNTTIDLGTDKIHMGPLSHQALAKRILDRLYYLDD